MQKHSNHYLLIVYFVMWFHFLLTGMLHQKSFPSRWVPAIQEAPDSGTYSGWAHQNWCKSLNLADCLYHQYTNCLYWPDTDHIPITYQPHTDHILATYRLSLLTTYQPDYNMEQQIRQDCHGELNERKKCPGPPTWVCDRSMYYMGKGGKTCEYWSSNLVAN